MGAQGESVEFEIWTQIDHRRKAVNVTGPHGADVQGQKRKNFGGGQHGNNEKHKTLQLIKTKTKKKKKLYGHNFPDTKYEILYTQNSNVSNMTNNGLTPKQNMNEREELPTYYNEENESEQSENTEISEEDSLSSPKHSDTPLMDDDEEPSQNNQTRESYAYSFDGNKVDSEQIGTPKQKRKNFGGGQHGNNEKH